MFGDVLGKEKVFLIQNIFPTTKQFIENKYKSRNIDVKISEKLKNEVIQKFREVIKLAKKDINIPFYDINKMKDILLEKYV